MIIDRRENAPAYFGLSPEMDVALAFVRDMDPSRLETGSRHELDGENAFYMVSEVALKPKEMNFEYHKKYIDIHMPVTGRERIAICSASVRAGDAEFSAEKDCGFFDAEAVNVVTVPEGWFCVCFPDDAHVPGMGEDGKSIVKIVVKIRA